MLSRISKLFYITSLVAIIILVAACSGLAETETPVPEASEADNFIPIVSATGKVVPEQYATLSISTGGIIEEILVEEGDLAQPGQVLLRLKGTENLQAAISTAEFELTSAQIALDNIFHDTDLRAAQALKIAEDTKQALEDLQNPELQQALALQTIANAEKAVENAQKRVNIVQSTADEADIDAAKAQVILAQDALDKAKDDFEPYEGKPETNLKRANFQAKLAAAQQVYDAAVRRLNAMEGTGTPTDISVAHADLAAAQAELVDAQREWEKIKDGPDPADVALLEAQIASALDDYEMFKLGPDPDEVKLAEARVSNAQVQLEAVKAALNDLELKAPFSGTVSDLFINNSEWIAPGQPALLLADLGHLQVETTDLNEIDVAQVAVGKTAIVTFDALPDLVLEGTITKIAPKASEGAGVNYTVYLSFTEIPTQLRWGMTAFVDIEIE